MVMIQSGVTERFALMGATVDVLKDRMRDSA